MKKRRAIRLIILLTLSFSMSSCLWPYKSDFDCKVPQGLHCKSLSEVDELLQQGKYEADKSSLCTKKRCPCKKGAEK